MDFKSGQYALVQPDQAAQVSAQGSSGLSLSGSGTLSPIQQGTPRAPLSVPRLHSVTGCGRRRPHAKPSRPRKEIARTADARGVAAGRGIATGRDPVRARSAARHDQFEGVWNSTMTSLGQAFFGTRQRRAIATRTSRSRSRLPAPSASRLRWRRRAAAPKSEGDARLDVASRYDRLIGRRCRSVIRCRRLGGGVKQYRPHILVFVRPGHRSADRDAQGVAERPDRYAVSAGFRARPAATSSWSRSISPRSRRSASGPGPGRTMRS